MWLLGSIFIFTSLLILYIKYRVVFTGEKCKGKIIDIVEQNAGYVVGGVNVKKHAYIVKIKNKKYHTAHGCIFLSLGKRNIGKEISVFKNEKYGNEGFQMLWFSYRDCCFVSIFIWRFYDLLSLMIKPSRFQFEKKLYAKKNLEVMEETIWKI